MNLERGKIASVKRLVLIDGHAMVYRAYYAYPALQSPSGQLVNAVYGFTALLLKTVDELKPDYLAVAFDLPVPTFRHEAYIAYQAKRKTMDVEMKDQLKTVSEVIEACNIPIFSAPGFEADDVIATVAKQAVGLQTAHNRGKNTKKTVDRSRWSVDEVIIVTGDRDMLQLVRNGIKLCMPIKGVTETRIFNREAVKEYLGVYPEQVVDYKALIGDSSDNYPGVPGIGPKTAVDLIDKFGSFENIFTAVKDDKTGGKVVKPAVLEKLAGGYDSGLLSKELAIIKDDVPVEFNLQQAKLNGFKENKQLVNKLEELGFRSLITRITGRKVGEKTKKAKKKTDGQMGLV